MVRTIDIFKNMGLRKSLLVACNIALRNFDLKMKRANLLSQPMSLQIEPTTKCNLRCRFCISSTWDRRGMDMDFDTLKMIIDQFPYAVSMLLQGVGEPFLNKDFFKMVKYCKEKKIIVRTTTNGSLFTERICRKIVDSGLDVIIISVEGTDQKFFDEYKGGMSLNNLIKGIKLLNKIKADGKPEIRFNFVASSKNFRELPKVVEMANDLGVKFIEADDLSFWGSYEVKENLEDETLDRVDRAGVVEILKECKRLCRDYGITFYWKGLGEEQNFEKNGIRIPLNTCLHVFRNCYISVDGFVIFCDHLADPRMYGMGDLKKESFKEIWNNDKYINLRKKFIVGELPEACKICTAPRR